MVGGTGVAAGADPAVMTSGLYTCSWPPGDRIVASTKAPSVPAGAIEQPSPSCPGGASPLADSGWAGTVSVQFIDAAACAAVWVRLMAAPVPSTGLVARSPSDRSAVGPLAKLGAGGTTALAFGSALALADGVAQGAGAALTAGAGLADGAGLPDGAAQEPSAD